MKERLLYVSAFLEPLVPPGGYEGETFVCSCFLGPLVSRDGYEGEAFSCIFGLFIGIIRWLKRRSF